MGAGLLRAGLLSAAALMLAACQAGAQTDIEAGIEAGAQADGQAQADASNIAISETAIPRIKPINKPANKPAIKSAQLPVLGAGEKPQSAIFCEGVFEQGGAALCQTTPNAKVKIARSEKDFYFENADDQGRILIGFDRDETSGFVEAYGARFGFEIKPREYNISRIDGLPPSQVSTYSEAQLQKIRESSAKKKVGFDSREDAILFDRGFSYPIDDFVKTSPFGAQRILNGEPKSPHYGVDIAAPTGTPIYAPGGGKVVLSDDDLYFEGAMVMIDHGQGLTSMYLHVSEIFVEDGQIVSEGDKIAAVGSTGRSTGPHLCWRLKWRNRNLDPELLTRWPGRDL